MPIPPRIFIALGESSDVSRVAAGDLQQQEDQKKLKEAIERAEKAEDSIRKAQLAGKWLISGIAIAIVIAISFWLGLRNSGP
jgi:hypothetical protein